MPSRTTSARARCMNGSCSGSSTSVMGMVWGQDRATAAAGDLDYGAAVGGLQDAEIVKHPVGRPAGDLALVDAEDEVAGPRLLEIVGGDDHGTPLARQLRDQPFQALGARPVEAG